ncbi:hypothetical protein JMJ35_009472 [Cladonia borealis]|uniref:NAD(P)-binding protein n=1 Tax=Cladonia borealis TaxID=184061 RepID=A0AA39QVB2_9LECA|nr:hypothetical protein JMJ35_009472 [Cladonia borealis]
MPRVFLITGTSTGFGKHLVQEVIDKGDIAVATARNPSTLSFENTNPKNYFAVKLDVIVPKDIDLAFSAALEQFGRVDVVINNAGYSLSGPFEELSDTQIKKQMDVNFFGLMAVTRKAMQVMREQQPCGGLIQQVTSIGGQLGLPTYSIYCASKWAIEGFTEAISHEVLPTWNINFTLIEPGAFRTDIAGRSMEYATHRHPAYEHIDARKNSSQFHGIQPGDPVKGAKAMYELAIMEKPPLRVVPGNAAYEMVMEKLKRDKEGYTRFETLSRRTEVDA